LNSSEVLASVVFFTMYMISLTFALGDIFISDYDYWKRCLISGRHRDQLLGLPLQRSQTAQKPRSTQRRLRSACSDLLSSSSSSLPSAPASVPRKSPLCSSVRMGLLRQAGAGLATSYYDSISRLETVHPRGLLVARRSTVLSRSRLGLLRFFHLPIRLDSPLPRQLATYHSCVCPYIRAVHSRLVQMRPEVGLAGPGAPVLGACGVLAVPCPPTGAAQVSVVRVGVAVRQVVEGSG